MTENSNNSPFSRLTHTKSSLYMDMETSGLVFELMQMEKK